MFSPNVTEQQKYLMTEFQKRLNEINLEPISFKSYFFYKSVLFLMTIIGKSYSFLRMVSITE